MPFTPRAATSRPWLGMVALYLATMAEVSGVTSLAPLDARPRGTPVLTGSLLPPYRELGLTNLVALAAEWNYVMGLRVDGTVVVWTASGPEPVDPHLTNIVAIDTGELAMLALRSDGTLWVGPAPGVASEPDLLAIPSGLGRLRAMAAGYGHIVVADLDGKVWAWGKTRRPGAEDFGPFDPPEWATEAVDVLAGWFYSAVRRADGTVRGWSNPQAWWLPVHDPPPESLPLVGFATSDSGNSVGVRTDGRVFGWSYNTLKPSPAPTDLTEIVQVAAEDFATHALRSDGTVVSWPHPDGQGLTGLPADYRFFQISAGANLVAGLTRGPVISGGPARVLVRSGDDLKVSYDVFSTEPYVASWWLGDHPLPGPDHVPGVLTNVTEAWTANLRLVVSNALGRVSQLVPLEVFGSPPRIVAQPMSAAALPGATVRFAVEARGSPPFAYQWRHDGVEVPGATNALLEIADLHDADAGAYKVVVRNEQGSMTSNRAYLSTGVPLIGEQTQGLHLRPGWDATLSVSIVSPVPAELAWFRDGEPLRGANDPTLALGIAHSGLEGAYWLVASNRFGRVTSAAARIRLASRLDPAPTQPSILATSGPGFGASHLVPPEATNLVSVAFGWSHGVAVRADGRVVGWGETRTDPIWSPAQVPEFPPAAVVFAGKDFNLVRLRDGTFTGWGGWATDPEAPWKIPSTESNLVAVATTTTHTLCLRDDGSMVGWPNRLPIPDAIHRVVAIATSDESSLALTADGTVWDWMHVLTYPPPRPHRFPAMPLAIATSNWGRACVLENGEVWTWSNGEAPPTPLPAVTNAVAVAITGDFSPTGFYLRADGRLFAFGSKNPVPGIEHATRFAISPTSFGALTRAPFLRSGPNATNLPAGGRLVLEVETVSHSAPRWAWEKDGVPIPGATNTQFIIEAISAFDLGTYRVRVDNDDHSILSSPARVFVTSPVQVLPLPDRVVSAGSDLQVDPVWAGEGPVKFAWQRDGKNLAGQTNPALHLVNVQASAAGLYQLRAVNGYGTNLTEAFRLSVEPAAPVFEPPPEGVRAPAGSTVTLALAAHGTEPLSWQWFRDGARLDGATNAVLRLDNVQEADALPYAVEVRNALGSARSSDVRLEVEPSAPRQVEGRGLRLVLQGNATRLRRALEGSQPMTYEWRHRGEPIADATNAVLELRNAALQDAGPYTLVARNALGEAESVPLDLHVVPARGGGGLVSWPLSSIGASTGAMVSVAFRAPSTFASGYALRRDGTVQRLPFSNANHSAPPTNLTEVVKLAVSDAAALALKEDGTLVGWTTRSGTSPLPPADVEVGRVIDIGAGRSFFLALRDDGHVVGWIPNPFGSPVSSLVIPRAATNVVSLSTADLAAVAVRQDGTPMVFVQPTVFVQAIPESATNLVAAELGLRHAVGLRRNGTVVTWGDPAPAAGLPPITNAVRVAASTDSTLVLLADGRVALGGSLASDPNLGPATFTNLVDISARGSVHVGITELALQSTLPAVLPVVGPLNHLMVRTAGLEPIHYEWRRNGVVLPDARGSLLAVDSGDRPEIASYSVTVFNATRRLSSSTLFVQLPATTPLLEWVGAPDPFGTAGSLIAATKVDPANTHVLESSVNLADWIEVGATTPTNGVVVIRPGVDPDFPYRFYRLHQTGP